MTMNVESRDSVSLKPAELDEVGQIFSANGLPISDAELEERRAALLRAGGYAHPPSQTPWQEIQRRLVGQLDGGGILEGSEQFQRIAQQKGLPRDNH